MVLRNVCLLIPILFQVVQGGGGSMTSYRYTREMSCGVQERINQGCIYLGSQLKRSALQCATLCQDIFHFCPRVVLNKDGRCYFYSSHCHLERDALACTPTDANFFDYKIVSFDLDTGSCLNGGLLNSSTNVCQCQNYWVGRFCERRAQLCQDLRDAGYPVGDHWVEMHLLGRLHLTKVKCTLRSNFVLTYVSISDGLTDLNMTYGRYKNWIYGGQKAYWIGLENIHYLNKLAGLKHLVLTSWVGGEALTTSYDGVTIAGEDEGYELYYSIVKLHRNDYLLGLMECLPKYTKFSAWDQDNDREPDMNLAAEAGNGWWYDELTNFCNPNGKAPTFASPVDQLDYVSVRGANLTYNNRGKDFEWTEFVFNQTFP